MASEKILPSIELSQALGLPVGVPVTPAALEKEVKRHTKPYDAIAQSKRAVRSAARSAGHDLGRWKHDRALEDGRFQALIARCRRAGCVGYATASGSRDIARASEALSEACPASPKA